MGPPLRTGPCLLPVPPVPVYVSGRKVGSDFIDPDTVSCVPRPRVVWGWEGGVGVTSVEVYGVPTS